MEAPGAFRSLSLRDFDPTIRGYRRKKVVSRTKSGCHSCKEKKVKCDETRPTCLRCRRNERPCSFFKEEQKQLAPLSSPRSMLCAETAISCGLLQGPKQATPSVHLLRHCLHNWGDIFQTADRLTIMDLAQSSSLVRNVMLAVASTHLRTVAPASRAHHTAESFHNLAAIHEYRRALLMPRELLTSDVMRQILLSAMLLSMAMFALPPSETSDPRESWVLRADGAHASGWMALQAGIRPLVVHMAPFQEDIMNFLGSVFVGGQQKPALQGRVDAAVVESKAVFRRLSHSTATVPAHWRAVFNIADGDEGDPDGAPCLSDNVYRLPVIVLAGLRSSIPTVYHHQAFPGKMGSEFRELVARWDEKALWLLGYWLGLMRRFEGLWWAESRARREHLAILMWLRRRHADGDDAVWGMLLDDLEAAPLQSRGP